jgi:uncharacterized protein DUF6962
MTVFTDYVLAAVAVALALKLRARAEGHNSRRLWAACFVAVAAAALAGGTYHGLAPRLGEARAAALWLVTYGLIGLGNVFILTGAIVAAVRGGVRAGLIAAVALRFGVWLAFIFTHPDFRYVVYDYAGTLLGLLVFAAWLAWRRRPGGSWTFAGVAVSLAGAVIQRSRFAPSPAFNHNDLFHVVQAVGLYLYFRGGRLLADAETKGMPGPEAGA